MTLDRLVLQDRKDSLALREVKVLPELVDFQEPLVQQDLTVSRVSRVQLVQQDHLGRRERLDVQVTSATLDSLDYQVQKVTWDRQAIQVHQVRVVIVEHLDQLVLQDRLESVDHQVKPASPEPRVCWALLEERVLLVTLVQLERQDRPVVPDSPDLLVLQVSRVQPVQQENLEALEDLVTQGPLVLEDRLELLDPRDFLESTEELVLLEQLDHPVLPASRA